MTATYDIAALEALRDRVRDATGPDRELDWDLERLFHPDAPVFKIDPEKHPQTFADLRFAWEAVNQGYISTWVFPKLSSSLDACAALQAELWPGSLREVEYHGNVCRVFVWGPGFGWLYYEDHRHGECLAWLSAILSALIAMHREAVNV